LAAGQDEQPWEVNNSSTVTGVETLLARGELAEATLATIATKLDIKNKTVSVKYLIS